MNRKLSWKNKKKIKTSKVRKSKSNEIQLKFNLTNSKGPRKYFDLYNNRNSPKDLIISL